MASVIKNTIAIRTKRDAAVLLGFGVVFAQSQAAGGHAPSLSLAKTPKFLAAERLHYFFKRSVRQK
jgi:hypothetical protein